MVKKKTNANGKTERISTGTMERGFVDEAKITQYAMDAVRMLLESTDLNSVHDISYVAERTL
jgi:hypothetical protein